MNSVLTSREFNIAGNVFRAYYDPDGKLVFVLDSTHDERKPNALLVINPVGDRKWDDILANDYSVDLETVRPKKNNKYQKLDVEYSGLAQYDNLIQAYNDGRDIAGAAAELDRWRMESVHRAAAERLAMAQARAARARETISRTNESVAELQARLKQLRAKLAQQKKQIGREPTKQSASKILRTDAQIDAVNDKLRRAKKRLNNAQRRLVAADEDAASARDVMARTPDMAEKNSDVSLPARVAPSGLVVRTPATDLDERAASGDDDSDTATPEYVGSDIEYDENITFNSDVPVEPKAEQMAENEEVKPLFDKDPEILDQEIAFKPIEFGVSSPTTQSNTDMETNKTMDTYGDNMADTPLSFVPPVSDKDDASAPGVPQPQENTDVPAASGETVPTPVLDTIKSVEAPVPTPDVTNVATDASRAQAAAAVPNAVPVAPVTPAQNADTSSQPRVTDTPRPVPTGARPVSPITGTAAPTTPAQRRPTAIYYVLLVLLIALSVFTLWLYQRKTSDTVPDLSATVPEQDTGPIETSDENPDSPFVPEYVAPVDVTVDTVVAEPAAQPEPIVEPFAVPEPVAEPEPEPVAEPAPVSVPEPIVVETVAPTVVQPVAEPEPVIETEEEILASKPVYNVSQNEKMFVAGPGYDTGIPQPTTSPNVDGPTCPDGTAPDVNGCCTGEIYTDMGDMGFNCCPQTGGDCFPPLF